VEGSGSDLIRGTILIFAWRKLRKPSKSLSQDSTNVDPVLNPGRPANEAGAYKPTWCYARQQTVCSLPYSQKSTFSSNQVTKTKSSIFWDTTS
jgi:hypothetical protein